MKETMRRAAASRIKTPVLMLAAATILLITMGIRQSMGLFVVPIVAATGVSIASVSFALAIGQLVWGAAQPVFGVIADHYGACRVLIAGALLLAAGVWLAPWSSSELGFTLTLGVLMAGGAAAGGFAILIGVTARYLPPEKRSFAAGFINAGGSFGQLLFAPAAQLLIGISGWAIAMRALSASALLTIPLAWLFRDRGAGDDANPAISDGVQKPGRQIGLRQQLAIAARALAQLGSYDWVWYVDIALASFAALINLPIREAAPLRAMGQRAPA
jgi:MFS family permease